MSMQSAGSAVRAQGDPAADTGSSNTNGASDPQLREVGLTGLQRFSGYVFEEFLPQLQGKRAINTFLEMSSNDPVIGAILFAIDKLIRQVSWRVEPASEDQADLDAAEFLEQCMSDMSHTWAEMISEILSMLPFGFSWHELCYKQRLGPEPPAEVDPVTGEDVELPTSKFDDGLYGWRKIPIRAQETLFRWSFEDDGGIKAFIQQSPPTFNITPIPIEKSLLFRTTTHKNNPEGKSVLRTAYRPWFFKKRIEEVEGIGIERDLAGFPMMYVDPKILDSAASPADKQIAAAYEKVIRNIRRDQQEGLLLPSIYDDNGNRLYELQLVASGGSRQFDTSAIIQRYSQQICMVVLADFILLGHESVGSFALSSDKTDLFAVALGSWLDMVCSPFNSYAIPRLFRLNGYTLESLPELKYGDIESPDLNELAAYITALANAGVPLFPNNALVRRLLEVANLPAPSDEEQEEQQAAADAAQQMKLNIPGEASDTPPPDQNGSTNGRVPRPPKPRQLAGAAS